MEKRRQIRCRMRIKTFYFEQLSFLTVNEVIFAKKQ